MTTTTTEVSRALLAALHGVAGLRPATPLTVPVIARVPWDYDVLALDIDVDLVEVRVVATGLPLPPLLGRAESALRGAAGHGVGGSPTADCGQRHRPGRLRRPAHRSPRLFRKRQGIHARVVTFPFGRCLPSTTRCADRRPQRVSTSAAVCRSGQQRRKS